METRTQRSNGNQEGETMTETKTVSEMTYEEVCAALHVDPRTKFVKIDEKGKIGFTLAKPEEIQWLHDQCLVAGFEPNFNPAEYR